MSWFGVVVSDHVIGRAVLDGQIALLLLVSNEEVPDVEVPGTLSGTLPAIRLEENGTLVVLEQDTIPEVVPLGL